MSKLYCIILYTEIVLECKSFITFFIIILVIKFILFIINVKTLSSPCLLGISIAFFGSDDRFHADAVERFWFILDYLEITRFTMLNLATKLFLLLCILKLYHWVKPFVFVSFCKIKSYTLSSTCIRAIVLYRLPLDWQTKN